MRCGTSVTYSGRNPMPTAMFQNSSTRYEVKRDAWRLIAVGGVAAAWLTGALWRLYLVLRAEVAGLDYLLVSLLLLPVAMLVSLAKAGVLGHWLERQRELRTKKSTPAA